MKHGPMALTIAGALAISLAAAPATFAHEAVKSQDSTMNESDMMGQGQMMGMMPEMKEMMAACSTMMQTMAKHHDAMSENGLSDENMQ